MTGMFRSPIAPLVLVHRMSLSSEQRLVSDSKFRTPDMLYPKPVRFLTLGLRGLRVCEREAHSKLSAGKHRVGLVQRLAKGFGDSRPMG